MKYKQHRPIWIKANGPIPKGMEIHHINGNKQDNRLENLSLVTRSQNMQKSDRMGRGYTVIKDGRDRPYKAIRKLNKKGICCGVFGTPCGAYMASRTALLRS